ncbi:MAG: hypothetical protein IJB91_03270 [Oscillospiraceae bacterium]|nr:hypothetical protein [Oscillospiraceae bacterium]
MMKRKLGILILSLFLFLPGCSREKRPSSFPLVTEITVHYENGPIQGQLHYTEDEKMQLILTYLRLLKPYGQPPEDPETADGTLFEISLHYADGGSSVYQQKADRYLKSGEKPWLCIPSQKAMELSTLLGYLEEDVPITPQDIVSQITTG